MNGLELKEIHEQIKQHKVSREDVMQQVGEYMVEDIKAHVKEYNELPQLDALMLSYSTIPYFESVMGVIDISMKQIRNVAHLLLKEGDIEDYREAAEIVE